jgi:hypothetical protein
MPDTAWPAADTRQAYPGVHQITQFRCHLSRFRHVSNDSLALASRSPPDALALGAVGARMAENPSWRAAACAAMSPVRQAPGHLHAGAGLDEGLAVQHGPDRVDGRAGQVGEVGEGLFADLAVLAVGPAQDTEQQSEPT